MATNNAINSVDLSAMTAHTLLANTTGSTAKGAMVATSNFIQTVVTQLFTTAGAFTYTPTAGMVKCIVEIQGAGGGSGGVACTATQSCCTGGAGGGGYMKFICTAAQIGAGISGVIGAGGAGGTSGANNGVAGGDTTFVTASTWTAAGGGKSDGRTSSGASENGTTPGAGGTNTPGTGTLIASIPGQSGSYSSSTYSVTALITTGAAGGSSQLGRGGAPINVSVATSVGAAAPGTAGTGYGGGGAGAVGLNATANAAGCAGSDGCVIVTEFIAV